MGKSHTSHLGSRNPKLLAPWPDTVPGHLAHGMWGGTLTVPHPRAAEATVMQRTQEAVKDRGSKVVPGVSQEQPGQCRKPWGTGQYFNDKLPFLPSKLWWQYQPSTMLKVTCSKSTKHRGILYSYISHAGTSGKESFILVTPGKLFAPFCLLGGSCRTQGCHWQCSAAMLSSGAYTAHPQLAGRRGVRSAPRTEAAVRSNSTTSLKSTPACCCY